MLQSTVYVNQSHCSEGKEINGIVPQTMIRTYKIVKLRKGIMQNVFKNLSHEMIKIEWRRAEEHVCQKWTKLIFKYMTGSLHSLQ